MYIGYGGCSTLGEIVLYVISSEDASGRDGWCWWPPLLFEPIADGAPVLPVVGVFCAGVAIGSYRQSGRGRGAAEGEPVAVANSANEGRSCVLGSLGQMSEQPERRRTTKRVGGRQRRGGLGENACVALFFGIYLVGEWASFLGIFRVHYGAYFRKTARYLDISCSRSLPQAP